MFRASLSRLIRRNGVVKSFQRLGFQAAKFCTVSTVPGFSRVLTLQNGVCVTKRLLCSAATAATAVPKRLKINIQFCGG